MEIKVGSEILHSSEGLDIYRNPENQFVICRIHYRADPKKRSPQWLKEAKAGMSPAKFAREYEIDFGAVFGERVFPEIQEHASYIIVPRSKQPTFPSDQIYYGGFDFGLRNPTSFHVYTLWEGVTYCVWELYEPCTNIIEMAAKIMGCPYWESIRFIAADPSINGLRHFDQEGNGASILDQFRDLGVKKFLLAPNKESDWLSLMRKHWRDPNNITFKIYEQCEAMIEEFRGAVFADAQKALLSANKKEAIADYNNHAMDDCKYYMLTNPVVFSNRQFKFPSMVSKWA